MRIVSHTHTNTRKRVSFSLPIKTNNSVFTIYCVCVCVCYLLYAQKNSHSVSCNVRITQKRLRLDRNTFFRVKFDYWLKKQPSRTRRHGSVCFCEPNANVSKRINYYSRNDLVRPFFYFIFLCDEVSDSFVVVVVLDGKRSEQKHNDICA